MTGRLRPSGSRSCTRSINGVPVTAPASPSTGSAGSTTRPASANDPRPTVTEPLSGGVTSAAVPTGWGAAPEPRSASATLSRRA
eukprot:391864-Pyramimonas_sp.AAC.1